MIFEFIYIGIMILILFIEDNILLFNKKVLLFLKEINEGY